MGQGDQGRGNPKDVSSSWKYINVTSIAADVDLTTTANIEGYCKSIRCQTAGDLVVTLTDDTTCILHFLAGERQDVVAKKIVAAGSSGCVPITVYR